MVEAIDGDLQPTGEEDPDGAGGDGIDRFRIKIWDKDNNDVVVYDIQLIARY